MVSINALILVSLIYVAFLFLVAYWAERAADRGRGAWLRSPLIYTFSLSVYCTAWTFYGAVGFAARSGLEFLTIYLGPTVVMIGWWLILRRLVRIAKAESITSIADLISSRFGKSTSLAWGVTLLAVVGTTPYIALQLQSVTLSLSVFNAEATTSQNSNSAYFTAFWVAVGLAIFTVIFGTRNLDVNERHNGVVMAIAVESLVKLVALLAVGAFVVWGVADGVGDILQRIDASPIAFWEVQSSRWLGLIFLSAAAFICLPRMFHVMVVENVDEGHLPVAGWAFPAYLLLMSLFVVPIAVVGLDVMPSNANPDLFVLTLPLEFGQNSLALLAFLGGFSSATSMVIVAAIALSTMVSNHIVTPIWLQMVGKGATVSGDIRSMILISRRISIGAILVLGYIYYRLSGGGAALAAIGLISFAGVAQVLPVLLGGLFWRGATRVGAIVGLIAGFSVWAYTMFIPSVAGDFISPTVIANGPWGIAWLRPRALFGINGLDPVVHAVFWSMVVNTTLFILGSLLSKQTPLERLQSMQFIDVFNRPNSPSGWQHGGAEAEDLLMMAQRILGPHEAKKLFESEAKAQGNEGFLPEPSPQFIERVERKLSSSVGSATAHAMVGQLVGGSSISVDDLMAVADETAQIMEYSNQLEAKSKQLENTMQQLRHVNSKLVQLSEQKDSFLSQISHELRTPMTSIRSFSEILQDKSISDEYRERYATIISAETLRLTQILDDLLDLSVLESGKVRLHLENGSVNNVLDMAIMSLGLGESLKIDRISSDENIFLHTDTKRLIQVFINLITNVQKYCDAPVPTLSIRGRKLKNQAQIDFIDNGSGVPQKDQELIFEKFARISDHEKAGSAGLGLAICREIMTNLQGDITYLPNQGGAAFRINIPLRFAPDL